MRNFGSSPLSRGIRPNPSRLPVCSRIIPALAGNTRPRGSTRTRCRDHPRSRGEYETLNSLVESKGGSSPLSRGILKLINNLDATIGIIPALAGNT